MIRVSLRNTTGEPIDFFTATDEDNARLALIAKLASSDWLLSAGDTITLEAE